MPLPPDRVDYLPMIDRPVITWPGNARVAFWVAPNIEHYEYLPPLDGVRNPWPRTPASRRAAVLRPRVRQPGRVLADARGAGPLPHPLLGHPERRRAASTSRTSPRRCSQRDWDVHEPRLLQHPLHHDASPRSRSASSSSAAGRRSSASPGASSRASPGPPARTPSARPDLVAEAGFVYQTDWKIDDQPAAHQGAVGPAGLHPVHLGAERRPAHAPSLRGRLLRARSARPSSISSTGRARRAGG